MRRVLRGRDCAIRGMFEELLKSDLEIRHLNNKYKNWWWWFEYKRIILTWIKGWRFIPYRSIWSFWFHESHRIRSFFQQCSAKWGYIFCRILSWWKQQYPKYETYFFNVKFFEGLISAIDGILLHFFGHVRILYNCFSVGHLNLISNYKIFKFKSNINLNQK